MLRVVACVILTIALIQLSPIALSAKIRSQEWAVRKPKGTLKVLDLFQPQVSAILNYSEGLVTHDRDNEWVPCLAEDWRWTDDQTIEFNLRKGVKFQNGERFDAEAVRINWEEYRKLESPRPIKFKGYVISDDTVLRIIDSYTVRFSMPETDGIVFPKFQWFVQIAPAFFANEKFEEKSWGYLRQAGPWGTGPFQFVEGNLRYPYGKPSDRLVFRANQKYWDRRYPKVKKIVFDNTLIDKREEGMRLCNEFEGNVDLVSHIRPLDTLKVAESPFAKVVKSKDVTSLWGIFNQRKTDSKWRDVRLRKAVNYAVNRRELWKYAAKGNAYDFGGLVPAGAYGHNPKLSIYTYDTQKAKALVTEAGYPSGFKVKVIAAEAWRLEAQIIGKMLKRVGLETKLDILTEPELWCSLYIPALERPPEEQDWDIALNFRPDFASHVGISLLSWDLLEGSNYRWIAYDPAYEKMWDDMAKTIDTETQEEMIRQLVKHAYDRAYRLFIYSPLTLYAVNKEVNFIPQEHQFLVLKEASVTDNHWSLRGKNN
jgi:peptide/nickel transport system substrate-binding protein